MMRVLGPPKIVYCCLGGIVLFSKNFGVFAFGAHLAITIWLENLAIYYV